MLKGVIEKILTDKHSQVGKTDNNLSKTVSVSQIKLNINYLEAVMKIVTLTRNGFYMYFKKT